MELRVDKEKALDEVGDAWCNDESIPPGNFGSRVAGFLQPSTTYYLIVTQYPQYAYAYHPNSTTPLPSPVKLYPLPMVETEYGGIVLTAKFIYDYIPQCEDKMCGDDEHGGDCGYVYA
jgi:hypothetical protein